MNEGIKPLVPLILYDFYYLPSKKKGFDLAYIIMLDDTPNFILIYSSSPNNKSFLDVCMDSQIMDLIGICLLCSLRMTSYT